MSSSKSKGSCSESIVGFIMIVVLGFIIIQLLPFIFTLAMIILGLFLLFFVISSVFSSNNQNDYTYNNSNVTSSNSTTSIYNNSIPKISSTKTEPLLISQNYGTVFSVINNGIDKFEHKKSVNNILLKKKSGIKAVDDYFNVMYSNIAYSQEIVKRQYKILENYRLSGYTTSLESYLRDFEKESRSVKSVLEYLAIIEKERYEKRCPEYHLREEAIDFDYSYWITYQNLLNLFIIALINDFPETRNVFMQADFKSSKQVIENHALLYTNSLLDNITFGVKKSEVNTPKVNTSDNNTSELIKDFNISGVTYQKENVFNALNFLEKNTAGFKPYKGYTDEQLIQYSIGNIMKYKDLKTIDFQLIAEPDNPYDSNAIKVLIANKYHVGYVPKEINQNILSFLNNKNPYSFEGILEVVGGPLKRYDMQTSKVVIDNHINIGFKVSII